MDGPDLEIRSKDKILPQVKKKKIESMEVSIKRVNGRLGRKWKRSSGGGRQLPI